MNFVHSSFFIHRNTMYGFINYKIEILFFILNNKIDFALLFYSSMESSIIIKVVWMLFLFFVDKRC